MEPLWFLMGAAFASVIIVGTIFKVNSIDSEHCAKDNNVFACEKIVTWVPVVPKD